MNMEIDFTIPAIYACCVAVSLIMLVCYMRFVKEKHVWMKLILVSTCVVNMGYLFLSLSPDISHALMANRVAYLGNVFQPLLLFLIVTNLCRVKISKLVASILFAIAITMLISAWSVGILPIFYQTAAYSVVDGVVRLVKTYGVMHAVYTAYVLIFTAAVIGITVYAIVKKHIVFYRYIIMMILISSINVGVWLVERFARGTMNFYRCHIYSPAF